jgi:hypothetical protein
VKISGDMLQRNVSRQAINDKARAAEGAMSNTAAAARLDRAIQYSELWNFSIGAAGVLDHPLSRVMTFEAVAAVAALLFRQLN